jgi:pentatricopeptide repeat protein
MLKILNKIINKKFQILTQQITFYSKDNKWKRGKQKPENHGYERKKPQSRPVNTMYLNQSLETMKSLGNVKWRVAYEIFQKLKENNSLAHISNYRKFLYVVGYKAGRVKEAEEMFAYIQKRIFPIKDRMCYNIMIHMYSKRHDKINCYRLFEEMKGKGIPPNSFTFIYLLKSFIYKNKRISVASKERATILIKEIHEKYNVNNPGFQTIYHPSHSLKDLIQQVENLVPITQKLQN